MFINGAKSAISPILELRTKRLRSVQPATATEDTEIDRERTDLVICKLNQLLRDTAVSIECEKGNYVLIDDMGYMLAGGTPEELFVHCLSNGIIPEKVLLDESKFNYVQGVSFRTHPMSVADDLLLSGNLTSDECLNRINSMLLDVDHIFNRGPKCFYVIGLNGQTECFSRPREVIMECLKKQIVDPYMLLTFYE